MPYAVALLVVAVALGWGGYLPWAMLTLELGAAVLLSWVLVEVLWKTGPEERARYLERQSILRRLPFLVRHPRLGSAVRILSFGLIPGRTGATDVEIMLPGDGEDKKTGNLAPEDYLFLFGHPFRRTRVGAPLLALTIWIGLSLVPLPGGFLSSLSPQAQSIRAMAESLIDSEATLGGWPWSLTSFMTLRNLFLWFAYLALFYVTIHLSKNRGDVERLTRLLLLVGIGCGVAGTGQWLSSLRELFATTPSPAGLRASGPFGNPNHYAAFMEMLLLTSVGWMGARLAGDRAFRRRGAGRQASLTAQEATARHFLIGLGVVAVGLGLIFSLSRSGITSALAGGAAFALLANPGYERNGSEPIELERAGRRGTRVRSRRRRRSRRYLWALALGVLGVAIWIGIEPVIARFELAPTHWEAERGRQQVWVDSLDAAADFWLTGSGLGSFRYVYPIYRSFGGRLYYTAAHNEYLQVLIELGAPGLILALWLIGAVWRAATMARNRIRSSPSLLYLHSGYCAGVIAVAIHGFTDFGLQMPANGALLAVLVGVVVGLER